MPKEGEFKTPLVPLLPILSILICLSFMLQYSVETWIAFGIALVVGLVIYFTYAIVILHFLNKEKAGTSQLFAYSFIYVKPSPRIS